jgi:hypothetical protein
LRPNHKNTIYMKSLYKLYFALALLFIIPSASHAQVSTAQYLYGTSVDWYDGNSMIHTSDGGYAIAGSSLNNSLLKYVMFIIKLDANYNIQWSKYISGPAGSVGYSVIQTSDGGYAISGATALTSGGNNNVYVAKLSSTGVLQWTNIIHSANSANDNDEGYGIVQTLDGGYAICALDETGPNDNMYVIRLGSGGGLRWTREMTGTYYTYGSSILLTKTGDILACGSTQNYGKGGSNMYLVKFDTLGTLISTRTIGGRLDEMADDIAHTRDGGYVLCGSSTSFGNDSLNGDVYVVKLDSTMKIQWTRTIGGKNYDDGASVAQTTDGGYAVAGITNSLSDTNHGDAYIVKLDSAGTVSWTTSAGGPYLDEGNSLVATSDGGCAFVGLTLPTQFGSEYAYLVKVSPTGTLCSPNASGGSISSGGAIDSGGTATVVTLTTSSSGTTGNGPTRSTICSVLGIDNLEAVENDMEIYPNPVSDKITIKFNTAVTTDKIRITDITGRELMEENLNGLTSDIYEVNVSSLSSGMYFITMESNKTIQTSKFIKN